MSCLLHAWYLLCTGTISHNCEKHDVDIQQEYDVIKRKSQVSVFIGYTDSIDLLQKLIVSSHEVSMIQRLSFVFYSLNG